MLAVLRAKSLTGGLEASFVLKGDAVVVGRDPACDFVLSRNTVSKKHARFVRTDTSYRIEDAGSSTGVYVNGKKTDGQELKHGDQLILGDVLILYSEDSPQEMTLMGAPTLPAGGDPNATMAIGGVGDRPPEREAAGPDPNATISIPVGDKPPTREEAPAERPAAKAHHGHGRADETIALSANKAVARAAGGGAPAAAPGGDDKIQRYVPFVDRSKKRTGATDVYTSLRAEVHEKLVEAIRLRGVTAENLQDEELWKKAYATTNQIIFELQRAGKLPDFVKPKTLLKDVLDEALGLGPIQDFLMDAGIEEVMVNGPYNIFVARRGRTEKTDRKFIDDERLLTVINRITAPLGRPVNQARPMVDARLADGSRVNAIVPPVSLVGPVLTIRKFPSKPLTPDDLVKKNSMSGAIKEFLNLAVHHRMNVVVAGGTAAGKTTLLNVLSSFIPEEDRILTIEDSAELQLQQPHVIGLEARPSTTEGTAEVTIRDLVRNALRMRPDRIVVGECRAGEALDMIQAMNTGHDGSLTTGHANSTRDMLARLETMCLMAKGIELPLMAIREQISRAVHLIIHCMRFPDGSRRINEITEVNGLEDGKYVVHDIYRFEYTLDAQGKLDGRFVPLGRIPKFIEDLRNRGVDIPLEIFNPM